MNNSKSSKKTKMDTEGNRKLKSKHEIIRLNWTKKHKILITSDELTVGWLYSECMRLMIEDYAKTPGGKNSAQYNIADRFIMLKSKDKNYKLDHYLSYFENSVSAIVSGTLLVPH